MRTHQEMAAEVSERFVLPPEECEWFEHIDTLVAELESDYANMALAFRHNIVTLISTVTIPLTLASSAVYSSIFQRKLSAERIRALKGPPRDEKERYNEAYAKAKEWMNEYSPSDDGLREMAIQTTEFLCTALQQRQFNDAAQHLLEQGVTSVWTAAEMLFRNAFEKELNLNPAKVEALLQDVDLRKNLKTFSLEDMLRHGFDISKTLGTFLLSQHDFSKLRVARAVLPLLFPRPATLAVALNGDDLWLLNQRRHLFVHRRGIVDAAYLSKTGDSVPIGQPLVITPDTLGRHLRSVVAVAEALIAAFPKSGSTT